MKKRFFLMYIMTFLSLVLTLSPIICSISTNRNTIWSLVPTSKKIGLETTANLFEEKVGKIAWQPNGTPVDTVPSPSGTGAHGAVADGSGGVIVAWYRFNGTHYSPYIQKFNSTGHALWGDNGTMICNDVVAGHWMRNTRICSDDAGGAIVMWQDNRSGNEDIYVQRINSTGGREWTPTGVAVCTDIADQEIHPYATNQLCPDGQGGAILVWRDNRNDANGDIYAQRVDVNGNPLWAGNGEIICDATGMSLYHKVVSDGQRGAIVVWRDDRDAGGDGDVFAQKINSTGDIKWTNNGVVICNTTDIQRAIQLCSDGAGGAVIVWTDERTGVMNESIYAQRVIFNGTTLWTTNGTVICDRDGENNDPFLCPDGTGGAIITWRGISGYTQRINGFGQTMWTNNGVVVQSASTAELKICTDEDGGAIIVYRILDTDYNLYVQLIDSDGKKQWSGNGISVCTESGQQWDLVIVPDGDGGAFMLWEDTRVEPQEDLYVTHLTVEIQLHYEIIGILAAGGAAGAAGTNWLPFALAGGIGVAIAVIIAAVLKAKT